MGANDTTMKKNDILPIIQILILMFSFLVVALIGRALLGDEFGPVMKWWFALVLLGLSCFPLSNMLFGGFHAGVSYHLEAVNTFLSP